MTPQNFDSFEIEEQKNFGVTAKPATMQKFAEVDVPLQPTVSSEHVATIHTVTIALANSKSKADEKEYAK